jgi:hypothetical protein
MVTKSPHNNLALIEQEVDDLFNNIAEENDTNCSVN